MNYTQKFNELKSTFNPDSKEIVYCEKCYQQEVY